jgi:large conductance mechanosensitive channel
MSEEKKGMVEEFKAFILQGDVVMLAVAVVIGVAFAAVVKAIVADLLTPLIAAIFGKHNFEDLSFTIHRSTFLYGDVINAIITFLGVGIAVFFIVVRPYNAYTARKDRNAAATTRTCPACLTEVPIGATRCAACTGDLAPIGTEGA